MKNFILTVLFLITLLGCTDNSELGSSYYYLSDQEAYDVGYAYGSLIYKSGNKAHLDSILIISDIIKLNNNDRFVIVEQIPNKKNLLNRINDDLTIWKNFYEENKRDSFVNFFGNKVLLSRLYKLKLEEKKEFFIADSIIASNNLYKQVFINSKNYYIISKKNNIIHGPLTFEKFNELLIKEKVDLNL